ncbi:MAG TPA: AMP-binding protein [Polyangiaceae bacterium]|nr:AMP-binding protein [Polyangiaceae bacterium]
MVLTLFDSLEHARRVHAAKVAVIDGDMRVSYAELHERCARLAAGLAGIGIRSGERVAILAANSRNYFEAFCAIPSYGMTIVPLNTRLAEGELKAILASSGARVLITDREPGGLSACVERVISIRDDYERLLGSACRAPQRTLDENSLAALFYTGGTTGAPKGVMLTHRNLIANSFHKIVGCSLSGADRFLAAPAMFHVAGIAPLVSLIWLGGTTVIVPAFDPERCLDLIEQHAVTVMMPVPTMLAALIAAQGSAPRAVSSLRMLGHAGSPIANAVIEAAHAAFPASELAQFYGATETSSIVTCLRDEQAVIGTELLGSCGRAVPGVAVRVVRADAAECAAGEVGEILVRGPNVTPGYWNDEAATAAALAGGWYRTGDAGSVTEDGYLFIVDRLKDMIITGGENVYSIEVEDVLYRHPAVVEAAVFGIPDPTWGEAVHAVVVTRSDQRDGSETLALELREFCKETIAGYKVPKRIEIQLEALPKSGPGKVLKRALREPFWRDAQRGGREGPAPIARKSN